MRNFDVHPVVLLHHCDVAEQVRDLERQCDMDLCVDKCLSNPTSHGTQLPKDLNEHTSHRFILEVDVLVDDDLDEAWLSWAEFREDEDN